MTKLEREQARGLDQNIPTCYIKVSPFPLFQLIYRIVYYHFLTHISYFVG